MEINLFKEINAAAKNIRSYLAPTPLIYANQLSKKYQANIFLKLENLQPTGSFKIRGAFNKLLSLTDRQKIQSIITASTGNHGAAVAYACAKLGIKGLVMVPEKAAPNKISVIKSFGANLIVRGKDSGETEHYAREYAHQHNMIYIPPYNDPKIIAGQGTTAYEIAQQLKECDALFVSIGGGGLIAGMSNFLKMKNKKIKIVGCLPKNSPVMAKSIAKGKIITMKIKPTISDGTAGNIDPQSITFNFCQKYVDDYVLVSEDKIKHAIYNMLAVEHLLIEGSAGVSVAAFATIAKKFRGKNIVIVICGANISMKIVKDILKSCS